VQDVPKANNTPRGKDLKAKEARVICGVQRVELVPRYFDRRMVLIRELCSRTFYDDGNVLYPCYPIQ
jgi:hypothetical protein